MTDPIMVFTTRGLVERSRLDAQDVVFEEANVRTVATEWRLKGTNELVRRDVWVNALRPTSAQAA